MNFVLRREMIEINLNMNSTISGGSNQNTEANNLQELISGEEYELLMKQVKSLFANAIEGTKFKDIALRKNADSETESLFTVYSGNETELEIFVQSILEKTAEALERDRRRKHRRVQAQGIAAAKARGVKCGRPEKETPENFRLIAEQQSCGKISMKTAAGLCGMSVSTFARRKKKLAEAAAETGRV